MPIPPFTIDGILPPYVGLQGPGGALGDMTPYLVSAFEVVSILGTTAARQAILAGWLHHRAALRAIGFTKGFQWLDGSFVEQKDPKDLDVVSFMPRPHGINTDNELVLLMQEHMGLFHRALVKATYSLDFFPVDLNATPETIVNLTRYYCGLFSHRRGDDMWKGMLQVRLEDATDDAAAWAVLGVAPGSVIAGAGP